MNNERVDGKSITGSYITKRWLEWDRLMEFVFNPIIQEDAMAAREPLINKEHGINIPRLFATGNAMDWDNITPDDLKILKDGPSNKQYFQAWERVKRDARFTGTGETVYKLEEAHNGALFGVLVSGQEAND